MCYGIVYTVLYIQNISWPIKKSLAIAVHIYLCLVAKENGKGQGITGCNKPPKQ